MQIPSPGADWPAIVTLPELIFSSDSKEIVPETEKTIILGYFCLIASRKLPGPESFKFSTINTLPPRPPLVYLPNPSAPGNAIGWECISHFKKVRKKRINNDSLIFIIDLILIYCYTTDQAVHIYFNIIVCCAQIIPIGICNIWIQFH